MATIIDADGHLLEPPSVREEYTEPAYRSQVIQIAKDAEEVDCLKINGTLRRDRHMAIAVACTPDGMSDARRAGTMSWDEIVPGGYDPHERIKDMDLEGIESAFFYPTLWLIDGDLTDPQVAAAACRASNNWLADFCRVSPHRFCGVAPLPLQDIAAAVAEMRRVVNERRRRAVFVRPNPFNSRRRNDPAYHPLWQEAQELDVPVAIHGSFGTRMPTLGQECYRDPFFFHIPVWSMQSKPRVLPSRPAPGRKSSARTRSAYTMCRR